MKQHFIIGLFFLWTHNHLQPFFSPKVENVTFITNEKDTSLKKTIDPLTFEFCRGLYKKQPMFISPMIWLSYLARRADAWHHIKNDLNVDHQSLVQFKMGLGNWAHVNYEKQTIPELTVDLLSLALAFEKKEWRFFDTSRGAFYLEPRDKKLSWVNSAAFSELTEPELIEPEKNKIEKWYCDPVCLFSKLLPNHKNKSFFFHFTGHGSESSKIVDRIAGIKAEWLIGILLYLEKNFPCSTLWVDSCYASPEKLAAYLCKRVLDVHLVTSAQDNQTCLGDPLPLLKKYKAKSGKRSVTLQPSVEQRSQAVLAACLAQKLARTVDLKKITKIKEKFPSVRNDLQVIPRGTDLVKNYILKPVTEKKEQPNEKKS